MFKAIRALAAIAVYCCFLGLDAAEPEIRAGKLDSHLVPSLRALHEGLSTIDTLQVGVSQAEFRTGFGGDGRLAITLDVPHLDDAKLARIAATGAHVIHHSAEWNSVTAMANLEEIEALLRIDGVRTLKLARNGVTRAGSATTQGDISIKTNIARQQFGYKGVGKIGIVSDSINKTAIGPGTGKSVVDPASPNPSAPYYLLSGMTNQNSLDLPASIQVIDYGPDAPLDPVFDEGAAMMEVIYDVAPGVSFAFAATNVDQTIMADNIARLGAAGCKIIVDDNGFAKEPFFQDGPIAQKINANAAAGVMHFSAIGNDADSGVLATYNPFDPTAPPDADGAPQSGNYFHQWQLNSGPSRFLPIIIAPLSDVEIVLQWNQPFMSNNLGAGATDSFALELLNAPDSAAGIFTSSADPQGYDPDNGNVIGPHGDAIETFIYSNPNTTPLTAYLVVDHDFGPNLTSGLKLRVVIHGDVQFPSGGAGQMTAVGHTSAAGTIAVGAVDFREIDPAGTVTAGRPQLYTSVGGLNANGIPYYFDATGNPLAGGVQFRDCPDIAAPDGVATSFFTDNNFQLNFYGTSASVSHAAGVAALVFERAELSTNVQVRALLKATARDVVNAPGIPGPDDRTGAGLLDGLAALNAAPGVISQPKDVSVGKGSTATITVGAAGISLKYQWKQLLTDGTVVDLPGKTDANLTLANATLEMNGQVFFCIVSNAYGGTQSKTAKLTVNPLPEITQQPLGVQVNPGATASFTVIVKPGSTVTYQWKRNTVDIPGANAATYTTPPVSAADDGALYSAVVSNDFGSVPSNSAKLTVNVGPQILSGPTATPAAAAVGTAIAFSASATGSVTYAWDFGDATTGTGASVSHAYAAAQGYTVTLTVTDTNGLKSIGTVSVFIFTDTNSDTVPDLDAENDNTAFVDAYQKVNNLTAQNLDVKKLAISLNFATKVGKDSITLSGTLPLPAGFTPLDQGLIVVIGGVGRTFKLDAKAKAVATPSGTFKLQFNKRKTNAASVGKYTLAIAKSTLQKFLVDEKLTDRTIKAEPDAVRVTFFFTNAMFDKQQPQIYTARQGKTGKTK